MAKKARPKDRRANVKTMPRAKANGAKRRGETAAARAQGPVTLQEARALAGVVAPVPRVRAARARAARARAARAEFRASPEALGIERKRLLNILQDRAAELGVRIRCKAEVKDLPKADLVVAADGVNSMIRSRFAADFKPTVSLGQAKFVDRKSAV